MLPRVDRQQRQRALPVLALVVVHLLDDDARAGRIPRRQRPTRPLDRGRRLLHLLLERLEASEVATELLGHVARRLAPTVGRQVGPEDRVQHVA